MWQQIADALSKVVGSRLSTSVSHACGQWPLALAVASRLMIAAARLPAVSLPASRVNRGEFHPSVAHRTVRDSLPSYGS